MKKKISDIVSDSYFVWFILANYLGGKANKDLRMCMRFDEKGQFIGYRCVAKHWKERK